MVELHRADDWTKGENGLDMTVKYADAIVVPSSAQLKEHYEESCKSNIYNRYRKLHNSFLVLFCEFIRIGH